MVAPVRIESFALEMLVPEVTPEPISPDALPACYPLNRLRLGQGSSRQTLEALRLSNGLIEATILPDLGGRIVGLRDLRIGQDLIPMPASVELKEAEPRGLAWSHGLTWPGRAGDLARWDAQPHEPEETDAPGAVFLFGLFAGEACSCQAAVTMHPGRAELTLEVLLINRTSEQAPAPDWSVDGGWHVRRGEPLLTEVIPPAASWSEGRTLTLPGVEEPSGTAAWGGWKAEEGRILVQASRDLPASGLIIEAGKQVFGVEADLSASQPTAVDRPEGECSVSISGFGDETEHSISLGTASSELAGLGLESLVHGDWQKAERRFSRAAGYDLGNPILPFLKEMAMRRDGRTGDLMSAHYASPQEPLLRVAAFLGQAEQPAGPNPLMAPLAQNPDALFDTVHWLLRGGLTKEAHDVLDESIRHKPTPLARVLMAWLLSRESRMAVDAAMHVKELESRPLTPPLPWRPLEIQAADDLAAAHPESERLQDLAAITRALPSS